MDINMNKREANTYTVLLWSLPLEFTFGIRDQPTRMRYSQRKGCR